MRVARTVQGVHWGPVSLHSHDAASGRSTSWLVSPPSDADSCQHRRMSPPYRFSPFGVCTKAALVRAGMSRWQISEMYAEGSLIRLRPGWYAEQHADEAVRQAVHDGGVLSGLHRLRLLSRDVWLPPHAQRHMFAQQSHRCPGWQLHRKPRLSSAETQFGVVPPWIALRHGLTRQSLEQSVAVVDSLARVCAAPIRSRAQRPLSLTTDELFGELARTPYGRRIIRFSDSSAESGLESITRVLLTLAGHRVATQVVVARNQRIDLVVDGILAIEVDGRTHDERRRTLQDRAKEADIRAAGYQVVRYSYQQIMHNWPGVYADILRMLTAA